MKILFALALTGIIMLSIAGCSSTGETTESFDLSSTINVYTRDASSGTRDAFFSGIDFGDAKTDNTVLVPSYIEVDGNGSMISSVANDDYGIGYISLSSLEESGLTGLEFDGVSATEDNVLDETYNLKRPFNYVTREDWTGMETEEAIVEAFVAYMFTVDGKATIANNGGILETSDDDQTWEDIASDYGICAMDNSDVTIIFGGSTSVEGVAQALSQEFSSKCGGFIAEHNHTGSSDGFKRTQGSEKDGANLAHIGFASRPFKDSEDNAAGTAGRLCWDAVVVVVNAVNDQITSVTAGDLRRIYGGEATEWSDIIV